MSHVADADPQVRVVEVNWSGEVLLKMAECPTCSALVLAEPDGLGKHLKWHRFESTRQALIG